MLGEPADRTIASGHWRTLSPSPMFELADQFGQTGSHLREKAAIVGDRKWGLAGEC